MRFAPPWYPWLKATVFVLLACNTAYYLLSSTWTKALDALAWFTLLALFALETGSGSAFGALKPRPTAGPNAKAVGRGFIAPSQLMAAIRGLRLAAAAGVGATAIGYVYQRDWLDAANTALWIAVVVLLESEMRNPGVVTKHRTWFTSTAAILYAGLGALVLVWAWRGEWFDAYDAALWLAAFAMIEMDVLQVSRRKVSA